MQEPPRINAPATLKSVQFQQQREQTWLELEALVIRVEREGLKSLDAQSLSMLPILYRATLSSLSVARTISLDRELLQYLESLSTRAYLCLYSTKRSPLEALHAFFFGRWAAATWSLRSHIGLATLVFLLGCFAASYMTMETPELFYTFVDASYAQGRGPEVGAEALRRELFDQDSGTNGQLSRFASMLMTHNSKIGMLSFVLGAAFGLPTLYLLFKNGLVLGAFHGLYTMKGLSVELASWILPHGVTEILALLVCGGAGFYIAESIIFPGELTRRENLIRRSRTAGVVVLGSIFMFMLAGLIEGIFRQTVTSMPHRFALAGFTAAFWAFYFGLYGRHKHKEGA